MSELSPSLITYRSTIDPCYNVAMPTSPNFLSNTQRDCLRKMFVAHPIELAYLYGSTAVGQASSFSDVDIALVVTEDTLAPIQRLRFELALEDELAQHCDLEQADVRVINDAPLAVRGQVVTQGVLLFERTPERRIEFETTTRLEYFDFLPVLETLRKAFFSDIAGRGLHGQRAKSRRHARQPEPIPDLSA